MQNDLIIISEYCNHCNIEPSFILMLGEDGLIDIEEIDNRSCFPAAQLRDWNVCHLYYDLSINVEGIDAIRHLLTRVESLQERVRTLETNCGSTGADNTSGILCEETIIRFASIQKS